MTLYTDNANSRRLKQEMDRRVAEYIRMFYNFAPYGFTFQEWFTAYGVD